MRKATPMMQQYLDVKEQYKDGLVLFRAGDFYETFYEDAKLIAKVANIALTKRGGVPMSGVPHHSVVPYIKKLLQHNIKIIICDQLETAQEAKGIIKRGVTRIITPGTVLEDDILESHDNNYLLSLYITPNHTGITLIDISTGDFKTTLTASKNIRSIIEKYTPKEVIANTLPQSLTTYLDHKQIFYSVLSERRYELEYSQKNLEQVNQSLHSLTPEQIISSGVLIFYLQKLQRRDIDFLKPLEPLHTQQSLMLHEHTLKNLDILCNAVTLQENKSLFGTLNTTKTPMGKRLLKHHLVHPLITIESIEQRLDSVQFFFNHYPLTEKIRTLMNALPDIERLVTRLALGTILPRECVQLKTALLTMKSLSEEIQHYPELATYTLWIDYEHLFELLDSGIDEQNVNKEYGFIKKGFHSELDEQLDLAFNSKDIITKLEQKEKNDAHIPSLKIKYNKIFGYYFEVSKSYTHLVPEHFERKQTLVNAERFTSRELKEIERAILTAEERIRQLEKALYNGIIKEAQISITSLRMSASNVALLDVFTAHACNAHSHNYIRPKFSTTSSLSIEDGRNPIVEQFTQHYVPNSCSFSQDDTVKIITGPNMAGKSTYLRQIGLICIMAQIGSFIPASLATLPLIDQIFTRIGAHDNLAEGESTFMVEMKEVAHIIQHLTSSSLILLDEVGRGTSTYDGVALAQALAEFLAKNNVKTIFATHYHYLNELERAFTNVKNYHFSIKEKGPDIIFTRQLVPGGTNKSYGIYAAKVAGVTDTIIERAYAIQKGFQHKANTTLPDNEKNLFEY